MWKIFITYDDKSEDTNNRKTERYTIETCT